LATVRRYSPEDAEPWDDFVGRSKNGVFLFRRGYMDYHSDRFEDASLILEDEERVVALLPANRDGATLVSHGGLTFGGLVTDHRMRSALMLELFEQLRDRCRDDGIERIIYKPVPHIFHLAPAEEDLYALFRVDARLIRRDVAFAVDQLGREWLREEEEADSRGRNSRLRNRARNLKRAREAGVVIAQEGADALPKFMAVLEAVLEAVHAAKPVHTLEEMQALIHRFPDEMRLFTARGPDGQLLAGAIVYESNANVAHVQYSANSEHGRPLRALDLLFDELMNGVYADRRWFDYGTSVLDEGRTLNESLALYKESQGARAVSYDFYELVL
jgi:hypothetical protein